MVMAVSICRSGNGKERRQGNHYRPFHFHSPTLDALSRSASLLSFASSERPMNEERRGVPGVSLTGFPHLAAPNARFPSREITCPIPADGRPMPAAEQPAATATHVIPMEMDVPVSQSAMPLHAIVMGDSGRH
jgi:hypothetical protein